MNQNDLDRNTDLLRGRKVILSTLWLFAVLNYLFCDVVSFMDANMLKQYLAGIVNGMHMTQGSLLVGSVLMEISISMVLFSRILNTRMALPAAWRVR